jgi:hypothetical protein
MKQTAVEWFYQRILAKDIKEVFEQAKEMGKQEIINAWDDGYDKGTRDRLEKISNPVGNAEQYYNETFKSEQDESKTK